MSELVLPMRIRRWSAIPAPTSLTRQFAMTGSVIMLVAMVAAGLFTAGTASRATVENTAAATALFMNSFLEPLAQDLMNEEVLPAQKRAEVDRLLGGDPFRDRFPHLEIWKEGGLVAYSTASSLIGHRFTPPEGLVKALAGEVSAHYTNLEAREHEVRGFSTRYLEIYVPIRETLSGRIIAVAEIHESTAPLDQALWRLHLNSWLAVAGATLLIMASLFGVVYRGNRTILLQQRELRDRMVEIEQASLHNEILKERVQRASERVAELNESYLRGIGAELHDGPAQLIGLAALKVEHVRRAEPSAKREMELQALDALLSDALRDIRTLSKGMMLPEIEGLAFPDVIRRAAFTHERRTGTRVAVHCDDLPQSLPHAFKICAYRFVQEGLNNAFRHAGGQGQTVTGSLDDSVLSLVVEDCGGIPSGCVTGADGGLGLVGLRERVESLGGVFRMHSCSGKGTKIEMSIVIAGKGQNV